MPNTPPQPKRSQEKRTPTSSKAQKDNANHTPSKTRKRVAKIVALVVAVLFVATVSLIVEARLKSFYGEPLPVKMLQLLDIKINGLPTDPDGRARAVTAISNLLLLPPEAVLPQAPAERFKRIGTQFGFVTEDTQLGTKYMCRKSDIKRIPKIALNIAIGLESFPEDLLRKVQLEYIVFCGDLQTEQGSFAGLAALPNNAMLLNNTNRSSGREIKELFFHEFYHMFEYRFGLVNDPEWMKKFDAGYLHGRQPLKQYATDRMGSGGFGFLNNYSRSFPYEDRAEIFAALMVSRRQLIYYTIKNQDEMLAAKIEYIAATAKKHLGIDFGPLWPSKKKP